MDISYFLVIIWLSNILVINKQICSNVLFCQKINKDDIASYVSLGRNN